nr:MAG TPA: hypothetical protein [Caudoviricetes sp.]
MKALRTLSLQHEDETCLSVNDSLVMNNQCESRKTIRMVPWLKNLKNLSQIMYNIRDKRADWARSPDEGCVNRIYRATLQIYRVKKYSGRD